MFSGGIAIQAADNLSIEAGAVRTNWSSYKDLAIAGETTAEFQRSRQ